MKRTFALKKSLYTDKFIKNLQILEATMEMIVEKYGKKISPGDDVWVSHFTNCREQGYHITNGEHSVSFSEHRSSDSIVVYYGTNEQFDYIHHTPKTEEDWRCNKFFNYDVPVEEIADFISTHIVAGMKLFDLKMEEYRKKENEQS